jgi:hypothetical protein
MVHPGNIVERDGHSWAVIEFVRSTPNGIPDAILGREGEMIRVSSVALEAVASASFSPGVRTKFNLHNHGVVVSTEGDFVLVEHREPRRYSDGGRFTTTRITPVPRGALARDNLSTIIKITEEQAT